VLAKHNHSKPSDLWLDDSEHQKQTTTGMRIRKEATRRTWRNSTNSSNLPSLASCPANRVKYLSLLFLFDCSDSLTPVSCNALNCTNTGSVPRGLCEGRPSRPETAALDWGFNKLATTDDADDDEQEGEEEEEEERTGFKTKFRSSTGIDLICLALPPEILLLLTGNRGYNRIGVVLQVNKRQVIEWVLFLGVELIPGCFRGHLPMLMNGAGLFRFLELRGK